MIFLKLFLVFSKIGLFNFGGGYAMLSFIQNEVVVKNHWMSETEFTDIVAISQMTPGPIGINAATYVGYTSVLNDPAMRQLFGDSPQMLGLLGIGGSMLATLGVIWLPFIVMILISKIIIRKKDSIITRTIFSTLRPAIIGLLASAALVLLTNVDYTTIARCLTPEHNFGISEANFGRYVESPLQLILSVLIVAVVYIGSRRWHWNPIYTIASCGCFGFVIYGLLGL